MNPKTLSLHCVWLMAGLVAGTVGCGDQPPSAAEHAGHAHAAAQAPAETGQEETRCTEHEVPERECGICHPDRVAELKPGESLKVRMASADAAQLVGVETARPMVGPIHGGIECFAEIELNQNQVAQLTAPVSGILQSIRVDLGTLVEPGQVLAEIWSASIAEAVAKAVLTHQTLERERRLRAERVTSEQDLQRADAEHRSACQQLRTLGFTEARIDALTARPEESVLLEVRAPFAGEIVERSAVRGALVEAGKSLFTLADRSTVWAMLHLPEAALADVRVGQAVEVRIPSLPGRVFAGRLSWIAAEIDARTRLALARAEVPNPEGLLKGRMFAQARVLTGGSGAAVQVSAAAIQTVAGVPLVFVPAGDRLFEARAVQLGHREQDRWEVTAGLGATEAVVVSRSFALKSALLISRLGAGCADD